MTHDSQIQAARPTDYLKIAALDRIAWPIEPDTFIPDGEHIWRVWSDYATLLVARARDGKQASDETVDVRGALVMFPTSSGDLFLHKIMVHPDSRGQGIGTALMQAALELADRPVLLTVNPDNKPAVQLYENMGYVVRDRIEGFYRPHEHRLLMAFTPE